MWLNKSLDEQVTKQTADLAATKEALKDKIIKLERFQDRLNRFSKLSFDIITIVGLDGYFKSVNPAFEKILGYTEKEILNTPFIELIHPDERLDSYNNLNKLAAGTGINLVERRLRCKDGSYRWLLASAISVPEEGLIYAISKDVTQLKKAEEEKQQMNDYLSQSEKMASIGRLAAGIAHEINNPIAYITSNLNTLNGYLSRLRSLLMAANNALKRAASGDAPHLLISQIEDLQKKSDYEFLLNDFEKALEQSQEGAKKIRDIVISLRKFSSAGDTKSRVCDINEEVKDALRFCWNDLKYKADVKEDYGDLPKINANSQQLSQMFAILLVNAAQSIDQRGEINIATYRENCNVVIRIRDTGCGIPPENMNKIFTPFFTTKQVGNGKGLGLYVAYNIVKSYDGRIDVRSETGKGAEFTVRLPVNNV